MHLFLLARLRSVLSGRMDWPGGAAVIAAGAWLIW
jgi:hypothetical protein